jgi:hypothetical protein
MDALAHRPTRRKRPCSPAMASLSCRRREGASVERQDHAFGFARLQAHFGEVLHLLRRSCHAALAVSHRRYAGAGTLSRATPRTSNRFAPPRRSIFSSKAIWFSSASTRFSTWAGGTSACTCAAPISIITAKITVLAINLLLTRILARASHLRAGSTIGEIFLGPLLSTTLTLRAALRLQTPQLGSSHLAGHCLR